MSSTRRYKNILYLPVVEPISISLSLAVLVMYKKERYLWYYLYSDWSRVRIAGLRWQWPMLLHTVVTDHRTINVLRLVWTSLQSTVKSITTPVAFSLYLDPFPKSSCQFHTALFSVLQSLWSVRKMWLMSECSCEGLYILGVVVTLVHVL